MYFSKKGIRRVQWGLGLAPEAGEFSKNFCVKSNLTDCKVTFNCKLHKKIGGVGCTSCSPNNFVGGSPVPAPIWTVQDVGGGNRKSSYANGEAGVHWRYNVKQ